MSETADPCPKCGKPIKADADGRRRYPTVPSSARGEHGGVVMHGWKCSDPKCDWKIAFHDALLAAREQ